MCTVCVVSHSDPERPGGIEIEKPNLVGYTQFCFVGLCCVGWDTVHPASFKIQYNVSVEKR